MLEKLRVKIGTWYIIWKQRKTNKQNIEKETKKKEERKTDNITTPTDNLTMSTDNKTITVYLKFNIMTSEIVGYIELPLIKLKKFNSHEIEKKNYIHDSLTYKYVSGISCINS